MEGRRKKIFLLGAAVILFVLAAVLLFLWLTRDKQKPAAPDLTPPKVSIKQQGPSGEEVEKTEYGEGFKVTYYKSGRRHVVSGLVTYWDIDRQQWLPAEPQIVQENSEGGYTHKVIKAPYRLYFSTSRPPRFKFLKKNAWLQWEPLDVEPTGEEGKTSSSQIAIPYLWPEASLNYAILPRSIKQSVLLHSKDSSLSYTFRLRLSRLTLKQSPQGEIYFSLPAVSKDIAPEVAFSLPAPFMKDSKGEVSDGVRFELIPDGEDQYLLKVVVVDTGWLYDESRSWPVIVDPTINIDYAGFVSKVTGENCDGSAKPTSYGADISSGQALVQSRYVTTPCTPFNDTETTLKRSFLRFNLPAVTPPVYVESPKLAISVGAAGESDLLVGNFGDLGFGSGNNPEDYFTAGDYATLFDKSFGGSAEFNRVPPSIGDIIVPLDATIDDASNYIANLLNSGLTNKYYTLSLSNEDGVLDTTPPYEEWGIDTSGVGTMPELSFNYFPLTFGSGILRVELSWEDPDSGLQECRWRVLTKLPDDPVASYQPVADPGSPPNSDLGLPDRWVDESSNCAGLPSYTRTVDIPVDLTQPGPSPANGCYASPDGAKNTCRVEIYALDSVGNNNEVGSEFAPLPPANAPQILDMRFSQYDIQPDKPAVCAASRYTWANQPENPNPDPGKHPEARALYQFSADIRHPGAASGPKTLQIEFEVAELADTSFSSPVFKRSGNTSIVRPIDSVDYIFSIPVPLSISDSPTDAVRYHKEYRYRLKVIDLDSGQGSDWFEKSDLITVRRSPYVHFEFIPKTVLIGGEVKFEVSFFSELVSFKANEPPNPQDSQDLAFPLLPYRWDFGDGSPVCRYGQPVLCGWSAGDLPEDYLKSPKHIYDTPGTYNVTFTTNDTHDPSVLLDSTWENLECSQTRAVDLIQVPIIIEKTPVPD